MNRLERNCAMFLAALGTALPLSSAAQTDCAQVAAQAERMRQHVEQQRARGVQAEQLRSDIEIRDRWAAAQARACGGQGAVTSPGGAGRRSQALDEAQRVLGLMNRMGVFGGGAPGAGAAFERELQTEQQEADLARQAAQSEDARRRSAAVNPFAPAAASGDNPFARAANPFGGPRPGDAGGGSPGVAAPDIPQRVAGQCPPPPARGRIDVELRSARGLTCRYTAPKSFCLRYADRLVGHQPGVATATDPDPLHVCQLLFAS